MADRTLVLAETTHGETVGIPVADLDGTALDGEATPPSLTAALTALDAFSAELHTALQTRAMPNTTKAEFSIGFAMQEGNVIPILLDSKAEGTVAITMEWTNPPEKNPSGSETSGRRMPKLRKILRRIFGPRSG